MAEDPPGYYNTNDLHGTDRAAAEARALTQEDRVLRYFESMPGVALAPDQVLRIMPGGTPLTSVRRAITNLTLRGLLVKTDRMRNGSYGAPVHTWHLASPTSRPPQQEEIPWAD